ncbi:hypothetical protein [Streptomyces sp. ODS28]|uniref:hypothetical protein n=1 Tax=Streptomyces sp. ODS28 TaxID=3136688 RepID=UPI0031F102B3
MRLPDRKETEVRGLLDADVRRPLPADLAERALLSGARLAHRRRVVRGALWALVLVGFAVFVLWVSLADPFAQPPAVTTPPLGW